MTYIEEVRQHYGNDLKNRGWSSADLEFMRLTQNMESSSDIYNTYITVFNAWIAGGQAIAAVQQTPTPTVADESSSAAGWTRYLPIAIPVVIIIVILMARRRKNND